MDQAETFFPPVSRFHRVFPRQHTRVMRAIKLLVMNKLPKSKKTKDSKATKPQIMEAGDSNKQDFVVISLSFF